APRSALFPYTTLFRSLSVFAVLPATATVAPSMGLDVVSSVTVTRSFPVVVVGVGGGWTPPPSPVTVNETGTFSSAWPICLMQRRSEEHTSELQSLAYL